MSIHRSLVSKSGLGRSRNVLTRYERILEMRKLGNWDEEDESPYGLPKVKVMKIKKRVKKKKEEEEGVEGEGLELEAGAEGDESAESTAAAEE
ncbi:MAG: small basic protein [Planctomycetes bacterium]|nr:small basic protein [Planctomycetota bacterium]